MALQLLLLLFSIGITGTLGYGASQDVVIYPLSTYKCDTVETLIEVDANLKAINDYGEKDFDLEVEFDDDVSEDWELTIKVDKWNNGDWDEDVYNGHGKFCDIVNQYVPKVWEKVKGVISPLIEGSCVIPKGRYHLKNFEVSRDEYDIPATMFGKFRITATLTDPAGTDIWCQVLEVQVDRN